MRPRFLVLVVAVGWSAAGHAATPGAAKPDEPKMPQPHQKSYAYDLADQSLFRPISRVTDPALLVRKIRHHPREAANVDETDQVRLPSTWWQPRMGFRQVSIDQMLRGPGLGTGPTPGKWTITKGKSQGVSPGFQIKDSKGVKYIIKFDPRQFPESATAADAIGCRLFWAAGYNVPQNDVAYFRVTDLEVADDATFTDDKGKKKKMDMGHVHQILAQVAQQRDGSYRCLASRFLDGKPIGPFEYSGRTKDDPDDLVPHELRREIRGLWTVDAWLNHADARGANTLDMWVTEGGRSFVRHYLIDFGSILGSSATPIQRDYSTGSEYYMDYGAMARQLPTLGLWEARWEDVVDPNLPSVGFVEAERFDPVSWRPDYPNPGFDERTARDVRWGARIVAAFTDDYIRAAVGAGKLSDPRASDYLVKVLIQRRDKLVRRWLGPNAASLVSKP